MMDDIAPLELRFAIVTNYLLCKASLLMVVLRSQCKWVYFCNSDPPAEKNHCRRQVSAVRGLKCFFPYMLSAGSRIQLDLAC